MTSLRFLDLYNIISAHFLLRSCSSGAVVGFQRLPGIFVYSLKPLRDGPGLSKHIGSDSV